MRRGEGLALAALASLLSWATSPLAAPAAGVHASPRPAAGRAAGHATAKAPPGAAPGGRGPARPVARGPAPAGARGAPAARGPARPGAREVVARWHEPTPGASAPLDEAGRPRLVLRSINTDEVIELTAASDEGGFSALDLDRAARLLRDHKSQQSHPVEPALLDLVYQAQRRFQAHEVRFVSSFRAPGRRGSGQHGRGRAVDLVVPGATDQEVAAWAQGLGFVGVGLYPRAGYVHLDVRESSYFWIDYGASGQRSRETPIKRLEARQADEAARARGRRPVAPYARPLPRVDAAPLVPVPGAGDEGGDGHD